MWVALGELFVYGCLFVCVANLPGQVKQSDVFWMFGPLHVAPPFNGDGLLQLRVRFWPNGGDRPAHRHSVHWLQALQPPFTANEKKKNDNNVRIAKEVRQWISTNRIYVMNGIYFRNFVFVCSPINSNWFHFEQFIGSWKILNFNFKSHCDFCLSLPLSLSQYRFIASADWPYVWRRI